MRELADVAERKEPALPQTASGEAMPRLNIGKPKQQTPAAPVKKAHAPVAPAAFKLPPRGRQSCPRWDVRPDRHSPGSKDAACNKSYRPAARPCERMPPPMHNNGRSFA